MTDKERARALSEIMYLVALTYGKNGVLTINIPEGQIPPNIVIEWHSLGDSEAVITVTDAPLPLKEGSFQETMN